ncbi:MAG: hypothetical protein KF749_15150 [Bacteroidetes bacterium]|nr:hypothetical protein [Bacteroidota bacterium]MCW5897306.1 hypothetical protein [Bacteroidota bacterium]
MNITPKTVAVFGYISIPVMLIMLALLWFRIVPDTLTIPFFSIALGLFLVRIVLRIQLARNERRALEAKRQAQTQVGD